MLDTYFHYYIIENMKNKILNILINNENEYVSGESIASELNVSRVSISKNIKTLRNDGYVILSRQNKGYMLINENDYLSDQYIKDNASPFYKDITVVESTSSTNDDLKQQAGTLPEGYVLISNNQLGGKGRNGRSFYCEKNKGVYMSIFLRPEIALDNSLLITACAGVSVVEAIQEVYGIETGIKWVNDIFYKNKKLSGILCEAGIELQSMSLEYMVVGIGINVHHINNSEFMDDIASSIEDFTDTYKHRNDLIISVLNHFYENYKNIESPELIKKYKKHSIVLHKDITVYEKGNSYNAYVEDIDHLGRLVIKKEEGTVATIASNEISVRL